MKKVLVIALLSCICSSALAGPTSTRNTLNYFLGGYALHTVTTNPAQPYQAVYSWRSHTRFDGTPGLLGYNGDIIGYTDGNGALVISVPALPHQSVYCGSFTGENVAVGSPSNPRSNTLNFTIQAPPISPLPPYYNECRIDNGGDTGGDTGGGDDGGGNPID